MLLKLDFTEQGTRQELTFEGEVVTIGRSPENDIAVKSGRASRGHCRIELVGGAAWISDLGSANGTTLNGEGVERQLLKLGDVIGVGAARLEILALGDATQAGEVAGGGLTSGLETLTGEDRRELESLRVFAAVTRDILGEMELAPLLTRIVDAALSLARGERAFLLLAEDRGREAGQRSQAPAPDRGSASVESLRVRVARSFDRADIPVPHTRLSMGIAGQVLASGEAVLSLDASRDERFDQMASVEDLRLRSVLCLPIRPSSDKTERVEGVLYVDNRLQSAAFETEHLVLVELLADLASVALRNARFVERLRETNRGLEHSRAQVTRLNEQLGRKVRDRDSELAVVRAELGRERGRYDYQSLVGASDGMREVFRQLDRIIESDLPVLIEGESGTGKELIARAIHFNGERKERPFVTENCAALPDNLLESELFGHTRGAFTGAYRAKKGLVEQASGGTLFLDEVGDMSPEMQKKILRFLQEGEFRPVGSSDKKTVDVRVLTASHKQLEELVAAGGFREDLYYRIKVLALSLPPLRERRDDIPLLAEHLLARAAREAAKPVPTLPHEVMAAIVAYDWPGNVRELENEMRRLVALAEEAVSLKDLTAAVREGRPMAAGDAGAGAGLTATGDIKGAVADLERRSIEAALAHAAGNKSQAARDLGISRFALQRKLDKYGLGKPAETGEASA
ncbi:MAG: sigma 54-interacting transcriptional regulator [Planctomycetota bacterium]|jgi:transcriptional regulator with GAF, ATPase, and Fis domain|nr:sigma 54-interacting transcriptional regulator [Planctomycetota bacterium]